MPIVTKVRREWSTTASPHKHLEGVCTTYGQHYTRGEVVAGIARGERWLTSAGGREAVIKPLRYCPKSSDCYAKPYITTEPDNTTVNNLENLPDC